MDVFRARAGLFFSGIMIRKGADMSWQAWLHNDLMSTSLGTSLVFPYPLLPVGFFLLALQYAALLTARRLESPLTPGGGIPPPKQPEVEQQL
jgi:TRAP-type C4-dicarboxylate transport system permease small subunit